MSRLYKQLKEYGASDFYGMHMPGHKRNTGLMENTLPYDLDITEIDGFDDLHHAEGILQEAQERAAKLYHAEETHFLVNGSTVGILSSILGTTQKGDTILVARNCHKSVYHAMYLNELQPIYLYPEFQEESGLNGEIYVEDVERMLAQHRDVKAVMIVSPTYDGVVSDVKKIAEVAHRFGVPLIVDEAHGAHFGFHPYFPENGNQNGADLVIHSVHKTMPAMTQTAILHMNGALVDREKVRMYLHMLQSSSPSYVLMASIDECMELVCTKGCELFQNYVDNLQKIREMLGKLRALRMVETEHYDGSKVVISVRTASISSLELARRLREEYHIQLEMVSGEYILAMTSVGDTQEGMLRFANALLAIDATLEMQGQEPLKLELPKAEVCKKIAEVQCKKQGEFKTWKESVGDISMEYAYLYPPGIPIVVPGERMTEEIVAHLELYEQLGFSVEGLRENNRVKVWLNE